MSLLDTSVLVGVYENETQARETLEKLVQAGFNDQQIAMVMRKGSLMSHPIVDDLVSVGVPEEDARLYESEYQAGHIIVLVKHDGRLQAAFRSLYNMTVSLTATAQKQAERQARKGPEDGPSTTDTDESLWRILKDAGLDHLL